MAPRTQSLVPATATLDTGDVGGEEVDAVAVEVAAGAVVVLGGAGVCMAGEDLGVAEWHAGVERVRDRSVAQRVGLMRRGIFAALAIRVTIRYTSRRSTGLPDTGRSTSGPLVRSPRHASSARRTGTVMGMVAGLLPLPTRCSTRCPRRVSA